MKRFVARALIVVAAILGIVFAQVAPASATTTNKLESNLAALWTTVLETPSDKNPFGTGGAAFACIDIDGRALCGRREVYVHGKAGHQTIRRGVLLRVQHLRR
jgi:hypothetical protein